MKLCLYFLLALTFSAGAHAESALLATAPATGGGPHVKIYNLDTLALVSEYFAYPANYGGGVQVALGKKMASNSTTPFLATVPSTGPVTLSFFNALTGQKYCDVAAWPSTQWSGGANIAAGDFDGDGVQEVAVSARMGGGPHVKIFKPCSSTPIAEFFAYGASVSNGVNIASGDVNRSGRDSILTSLMSGPSHLKVFSLQSITASGWQFAQTVSLIRDPYITSTDRPSPYNYGATVGFDPVSFKAVLGMTVYKRTMFFGPALSNGAINVVTAGADRVNLSAQGFYDGMSMSVDVAGLWTGMCMWSTSWCSGAWVGEKTMPVFRNMNPAIATTKNHGTIYAFPKANATTQMYTRPQDVPALAPGPWVISTASQYGFMPYGAAFNGDLSISALEK